MTTPAKEEKKKTTALTPIQEVRDNLSKMTSEFRLALPAQIPAEKFVRTLITTIQMNQHLLECDRRSLYAAAMKAAQDGLLMDGREATAVVFRSKGGQICQYMPMVGGILKKMRNSGDISSVSAHVAKENDLFEYELGDNERIIHKPLLSGDRGKTIASYAIVKTKDGGIYRDVMTLTEIEKIRNTSKAKDAGPWVDWYDEMAEKSVLKRISKRAPSSADVEQVIDHDNEVAGIPRLPETELAAPGEGGRPKALQSIVDAETTKEEPKGKPQEDDGALPFEDEEKK